MNTWPCVFPTRGNVPAQRVRAVLQAPARAGNPPLARIDASGRICERAVVTALGWAGGDRLTFTADAGVVTAHCDPAGMVTLPASGYLTIPGFSWLVLLARSGRAKD